MARNTVRSGLISSYDQQTGTASIYYPDRNDVTDMISVFAPFGLTQRFKKDDQVLVINFSDGEEAGIIIGGYQVDEDTPKAGLIENDGSLIMTDRSGTFSLGQIIALKNQVDALKAQVDILQARVDAL